MGLSAWDSAKVMPALGDRSGGYPTATLRLCTRTPHTHSLETKQPWRHTAVAGAYVVSMRRTVVNGVRSQLLQAFVLSMSKVSNCALSLVPPKNLGTSRTIHPALSSPSPLSGHAILHVTPSSLSVTREKLARVEEGGLYSDCTKCRFYNARGVAMNPTCIVNTFFASSGCSILRNALRIAHTWKLAG